MSSPISLWAVRTSPANNSWTSATYGFDPSGNGLYVAVSKTGTGNRVMTSYNGITWTSKTSPADYIWNSVTYGFDPSGNGVFVAVSASAGGTPGVMTSRNGNTWTLTSTISNSTWNSVTYGFDPSGNGLFVAVASSGNNKVMTSRDGINWTIINSSVANATGLQWSGITYGNGLFVATSVTYPVGSNYSEMISQDGITWTAVYADDVLCNNIVYGNGLFVGTTTSGNLNFPIRTSYDAYNWAQVRWPYEGDSGQLFGVAYGNGVYVATGFTYFGGPPVSKGGINWVSSGFIRNVPFTSRWNTVTYGNGLFVSLATNGNIATANTTPPTITNFSVPTKAIGNASFRLTDPSSNSSGEFSYTSSNELVATINGKTVTIVGEGTSIITATQASTINYTGGDISANFVVTKPNPTITNFSVPTKTLGDAPFALIAPTSNSTGAFSYTSSNLSVATISGNIVTIVGGGTSIITATQAATENYTSGDISANFVVLTQVPPTITNFIVPTKTFGNVPFTLTDPSSNSSGAFTYTSSNTSVATISGNTVTIIGVGTSIITATQAATANYFSGDISANFIVNQSTPNNPTIINNTNELLYFMQSTAVYGSINSSISINYNLIAPSYKVLVTNKPNGIIIKKIT